MADVALAASSLKIGFGLVLGLTLAGCGTMARMQSAPPLEKQTYLTARIDEVLERRLENTQPGLAIMIVKDGTVIYNRSRGLADSAKGIAITENTPFELASITKPMTALAVMQLKEKGRLALTDSVMKWLPELPDTWGNVTIHHLLTHQAGMPEFAKPMAFSEARLLNGMTNQGLLQRFTNAGVLSIIPGTNFEYSNGNYVVLAEIISRVSGKTYGQYMRENIFTPLGMNSSSVFGEETTNDVSPALGFARGTNFFFGITLATVGSIGVASTTADMHRFVAGLLAGKIVSLESLAMMTTPQTSVPAAKDGAYYGYGWYVGAKSNPLSVFAHRGDQGAFHNALRINNSKGIYYVMLSNGGNVTDKLINDVLNIVQPLYEQPN